MDSGLFIYIGVYVFLIGICTGSFLNVASLRALWNEDIVFMPSRCPKCKNSLKWYHNIPVLSYLFLRGKCAFCKEPISIQYPIVELTNALLWTFIYIKFGFTFKTLFLCILTSFFVVMTITDIKEKVVFNVHSYPIIFLGLLYNLLNFGDVTILESMLGVVVGFLIFEVLANIGYLFTSSRAFGEGDTIITMGIGAFFGYKVLIPIIFLSIFLQAIFAIPLMIYKNIKSNNKKMVYALIGAVCCVLLAILLNYFIEYINSVFALIFMMLIFLALVIVIKTILSNIKNKTEDELFCLPFGPALITSSIIFMFFQNEIFELIKNIF